MPEAVDSAANIPAQAAHDAGYVGVLRYLGFPGDSRRLGRAEVDAHFAAGNAVALIREENGRELLGGTDAGHRLGQQSSQLADELGWPHDRPVYLTQDTGFARSQWGAVRDAIGTANTYRPCWFYGGGDLGDWLVDQGVIPAFWLAGAFSWTSTWNGRRWDPNADPVPQLPATRHAVLAQTPQQPVVGGVTCDRNIILGPDWGQYHPDQPITPPEDDVLTQDDKDLLGQWMQDQAKNVITAVDAKIDALAWGVVAGNVKVLEAIKTIQAGGTVDLDALSKDIGDAVVSTIADKLKS